MKKYRVTALPRMQEGGRVLRRTPPSKPKKKKPK